MANATNPTNATSNTGKTANTTSTAAATKPGHEGAKGGGMQNTQASNGAQPQGNVQGNMPKGGTTDSTLVASRDVKDFTLTPPMVDVRGWNVALSGGDTIGTVERIMLDSRDQTPRYLAVTPSDRQGHMLLPIGLGTVDRDHRRIVLRDIKPEVLKSLPLLTNEVVTREMERSIFGTVKGTRITDQTVSQIYTDPLYDASRLFGSKGTHSSA